MKTRCTRRNFLKFSAGGALSITLANCQGSRKQFDALDSNSHQPTGQHPNLLFVFPDQMRGSAMGFLGEEPVLTPNLDKFAAESLVLPQAVSNYPVCSPYRAMLMTGRFSHANQVLSNCTSKTAPYNCQLQESDRCWSDVLKDKGYSLGYIGKWHLDSPHQPYIKCSNNSKNFAWNEWCQPQRRHGFDFWYAYGTYDYHMNPMYWSTNATRQEFHYAHQWGPEHEADLAIKYIKNEGGKYRKAQQPFALVVSMNPPHTPYNQLPQRYVDKYKDLPLEKCLTRKDIPPATEKMGKYYRNNIKNYYANITGVDDQFGRILDTLKQQGLEKNTIVVFTSDHGNCLGIHNKISKNNHYEESMRVPFMIRWPGKIKPRHDNLLLSSIDIYPTLVDLMGYSSAIPQQVDGTSHAQLFRTGKGKRPDSQWYIWVPVGEPAWGRRGIRTDRYTLVIDKKPSQTVTTILHDNNTDKFQMKNIAAENPKIVKQLTSKLEAWLKKANDPWLKQG